MLIVLLYRSNKALVSNGRVRYGYQNNEGNLKSLASALYFDVIGQIDVIALRGFPNGQIVGALKECLLVI